MRIPDAWIADNQECTVQWPTAMMDISSSLAVQKIIFFHYTEL
jgi:hypothetical protein